MFRARHTMAIASSSCGGMMVPVGLAGLAMITPAGAGSSSARIFADIWNRSAGPQPIFDDQIALNNDAHIPAFLVIGFQYEPYFNTTQDTPDKCSEAALDGVGRTTLRYIYAQ